MKSVQGKVKDMGRNAGLTIVEKVEIAGKELTPLICGVNDINLRHLETVFGGVVFSRGNAIMLDSDNPSKRQEFRRVVLALESLASRGLPILPDIILNFSEPGSVPDNVIAIPHGEKVYPRTPGQGAFVRLARHHSLTVAVGPSGTGKTFLAVALGLSEVLGKRRRKLLLTRPVVEAGESLGFLPGDLTQKISPYLRPLYDAMEDLIPFDLIQRMEEQHQLEIAPLAYMRGRSLKNCFVILDEAQNTTRGQMKMFLTRLGEGAKAVVTGDISQIDLPRSEESGLLEAAQVLDGVEDVATITFQQKEVIRSRLVRNIVEAYEKKNI